MGGTYTQVTVAEGLLLPLFVPKWGGGWVASLWGCHLGVRPQWGSATPGRAGAGNLDAGSEEGVGRRVQDLAAGGTLVQSWGQEAGPARPHGDTGGGHKWLGTPSAPALRFRGTLSSSGAVGHCPPKHGDHGAITRADQGEGDEDEEADPRAAQLLALSLLHTPLTELQLCEHWLLLCPGQWPGSARTALWVGSVHPLSQGPPQWPGPSAGCWTAGFLSDPSHSLSLCPASRPPPGPAPLASISLYPAWPHGFLFAQSSASPSLLASSLSLGFSAAPPRGPLLAQDTPG